MLVFSAGCHCLHSSDNFFRCQFQQTNTEVKLVHLLVKARRLKAVSLLINSIFMTLIIELKVLPKSFWFPWIRLFVWSFGTKKWNTCLGSFYRAILYKTATYKKLKFLRVGWLDFTDERTYSVLSPQQYTLAQHWYMLWNLIWLFRFCCFSF